MPTAKIRPATVPDSCYGGGYKSVMWPTANPTTTSLVEGEFCVLSSGLLAPVTLDGNGLVTSSNVIAAVTAGPYTHTLNPAGSVPIRQTLVGATLLYSDVVVEVNYYDLTQNPNHQITRDLVGSSLALFKSGGIYYARRMASYSGLATVQVVDLVDPVTTVYGRILVKPNTQFRLF